MELLHKLFNMCLTTRMILDTWRKSIINPIPKSAGLVNDPLKYRGLSLQSCVYKIMSVIINKRITKYIDQHEHLGRRTEWVLQRKIV